MARKVQLLPAALCELNMDDYRLHKIKPAERHLRPFPLIRNSLQDGKGPQITMPSDPDICLYGFMGP